MSLSIRSGGAGKMTVLVTGASGFVGRALLPLLAQAGCAVRPAVRAGGDEWRRSGFDAISVGDIGPDTDWRQAVQGAESVIHLAGRAHVLCEAVADPLAEFRRVNVEGTRRLLLDARAAGVRRFIFLSSVKVNGGRSGERPFTEGDTPSPDGAYGLSKLEAEQLVAQSPMETVIVRPPLVYGPKVKGNFLRLLQLCHKGLPLPLGGIHNVRSLIYVGNLAAAIIHVLNHTAAAGNIYLVRDGEDVSVPQLVRRLSAAMGRRAHLVPVPPALLRAGVVLAGRRDVAARLLDSLAIDDRRIRNELAWRPPFTLDDGLRETGVWFRASVR